MFAPLRNPQNAESPARKAALARVTLALTLSHQGRGDLVALDFGWMPLEMGLLRISPNYMNGLAGGQERGGEASAGRRFAKGAIALANSCGFHNSGC